MKSWGTSSMYQPAQAVENIHFSEGKLCMRRYCLLQRKPAWLTWRELRRTVQDVSWSPNQFTSLSVFLPQDFSRKASTESSQKLKELDTQIGYSTCLVISTCSIQIWFGPQKSHQLNEEGHLLLHDITCLWCWLKTKMETMFNADVVARHQKLWDEGCFACSQSVKQQVVNAVIDGKIYLAGCDWWKNIFGRVWFVEKYIWPGVIRGKIGLAGCDVVFENHVAILVEK